MANIHRRREAMAGGIEVCGVVGVLADITHRSGVFGGGKEGDASPF